MKSILWALLITWILFPVNSLLAQDLFDTKVDYAVRTKPFSVFSVDFDLDGFNDLATVNNFADNVSILLGNGDGTFQPAVNYAAGDGPLSVFSIDFDGDGFNDMAVANGNSDNVSILLGNGDGTFQPVVNYAVGDVPLSVFSIDFDGDGFNDLAAANRHSGDVSILLGNGDGTFQPAVNYATEVGSFSVFSIDFDGDGYNDLATANLDSDTVSILLGNGDGTFQPAVNYAVGNGSRSVFSIDFNLDGFSDLAVANHYTDNVSILLGNGDGTFQPVVNYAVGSTPASVFSIDFDFDGFNDLATANFFSDNVSILLGNGDGTFQPAVNYAVGSAPASIFSIDFDGDGYNDLATANNDSHNVSILLNLGGIRDLSITDTPTDQGGFLDIGWNAFPTDAPGLPDSVATYAAQRFEAGSWTTLTTIAAAQADSYEVTVPTPDIFTIGQPETFSQYRVVANSSNPAKVFYSVVDGAYSIDNLAPPKPNVTLLEIPGIRFVNCVDPSVPDMAEVCFYRGLTSGFEPGIPVQCSELLAFQETLLHNYFYRVQYTDTHGNIGEMSDEVTLADPSGVGETMPLVFAIEGIFPNPLNPSTTIRYSLPESSPVNLKIYDISGKLVRSLISGEVIQSGDRSVVWNGTDDSGRGVSAGVYFAKLSAGEFVDVKRMTLVK